MKSISSILLKQMKHEKIITHISDLYDSYVGKPLTLDTLNKLEVEVIMYLNSFYDTPDYNNESLEYIKKVFYNTLYIKLKDQVNKYN